MSKQEESNKPPDVKGWESSDVDEIERRRHRARTESMQISALESEQPLFGSFMVRSGASAYRVEIRHLTEHHNACECADWEVNALGTCKHIEAVLIWLEKRGRKRFREGQKVGSPRTEIWLDRRLEAPQVRLDWSATPRSSSKLRTVLAPLFRDDGQLLGDPLVAIPALRRQIESLSTSQRSRVRLSAQIDPWLARLTRLTERGDARRAFLADAAQGKRSLQPLKQPLFPYQQEGMLHLAFTERALLADEMGLGKTVQAIAACELLAQLHRVSRVLVVSPLSLKGEWAEQIRHFCDRPYLLIEGAKPQRQRSYRKESFYYLANYEQVLSDGEMISGLLAPEVVILDEAQRIKNWQSKTAAAVKRLESRFAFVLSGTPLENRIDEIYSVVQFLDPHLFGPLFRFNRNYYQLDDKGRPVGYKNLDALHRQLRPILLRRRKEEVEGELPERTTNSYFVAMAPEQARRYEQYESSARRLTAQLERRPLSPQELERLQQLLASMRMLCDSPYILDSDCKIAPKLDELEEILRELLSGEHKIIIFSEWERMLTLLKERLDQKEISYAWHTGSLSQAKRREQIDRFKQEAACRLFLSTDSGGVGLNLQVADTVINLDLPWNPGRLEQRIARAWRKHQRRPVQVINLITEDSIESQMQYRIERKRELFHQVLDGEGPDEMSLPSGRIAVAERMAELMGHQPQQRQAPPPSGKERLREELLARWAARIDRIELSIENESAESLLIVVDRLDEALASGVRQAVAESYPEQSPPLHLIDRQTHQQIQGLIESGLLRRPTQPSELLHGAEARAQPSAAERHRRCRRALPLLQQAQHKQRMAEVLAFAGFAAEACAPLSEALREAAHALLALADVEPSEEGIRSIFASAPSATATLWQRLSAEEQLKEKEALSALNASGEFIESVRARIDEG